MSQKYPPSGNEKASRGGSGIQAVGSLPPRIIRSQSANDAAGAYGDYMYNDQQYMSQDPRYYHGSGGQTYTDPYGSGYDAYGYHQYAAQQAPDDPTAAYHQYHAQQAAMQQQQQQRSSTHSSHGGQLAPIYDNVAYNTSSGYYGHYDQRSRSPPQQSSGSKQQQSNQQQAKPTGAKQGAKSDGKEEKQTSPAQASSSGKGPAPPDLFDASLYSPYQIPAEVAKGKIEINVSKPSKKSDDGSLPSSPDKLKHAATVGDVASAHATYQAQGGDLRYELEQIQSQKEMKRQELESKRKKLIDKNSLTMIAQKELEETKKKWNQEREEIIKSYGGTIPTFIVEADKLRKDLENMSNRNSALQASLEVISSHLQNELYQLQYQLKVEKEIAGQTHEHNIELERRVRELRIEKLELETELKTEKDKHDMIKNNITDDSLNNDASMNMAAKSDIANGANKKRVTIAVDEEKFREYPPESTVIQNLLQSQVEFYFSDYNLKRDKRLLNDVVKPPKKGFLKLDDVMKLSRIRQLCSEIETLEEALRRSTILTLIREKKTKQELEEEANRKEDSKATSNDDDDDEKYDDDDDDYDFDDDIDDDDEYGYRKGKKNKYDVSSSSTKSPNRSEVAKKGGNGDESELYLIWVGRLNFEKPREKEFPFRRTVFIFGIPVDGSERFLHEMLKPFGTVSKIQFDHSPDGIDRKIGTRFLNKPRVYTLYYYDPNKPHEMNNNQQLMHQQQKINGLSGSGILDDDDELLMSPNREEMIFKTEYDISGGAATQKTEGAANVTEGGGAAENDGGDGDGANTDGKITSIKCHKCGKDKSVSEGFYTTIGWKVIYCAQCAAQLAEDQLNVYYKERNIPQYQHNPRHKWLGSPPNDVQKRKTALVVFASQRQASKCAYVRTRIAYKGAFATHFHHYSKVKKEILLSEQEQTSTKGGNDGSTIGDGDNLSNKGGRGGRPGNKNMDGMKGGMNNRGNMGGDRMNNNVNNQQQGMGGPGRGGRNQGNLRGRNRQNNNMGNNNRNNQMNRGYNNNRNRGGMNQRGGRGYNRRGMNQRYGNRSNYGNQGGMHQQQYGTYAQQQAQLYQGQQPPQSGNSNKPKMKGPGLHRQSSAPTMH
eukprot:CAMPEP_0197078364 /NCGR_PEP_ID=MMETSP1384-20130603/213082_1 /TAXON_ID=29189 /ORGANISM="Ammonia sp." /LENGTH=1108 /DNA_ID=CAMNT_0042517229 /DNA_START=15 /DNA_END=3341 /DNA_ORIENTATION=-